MYQAKYDAQQAVVSSQKLSQTLPEKDQYISGLLPTFTL